MNQATIETRFHQGQAGWKNKMVFGEGLNGRIGEW